MDNGPIMEFKDMAQANECLREWQSRLFLDDWIIKLEIKPLSEMADKENVGESSYKLVLKSAIISIAIFDGINAGMCKIPHELTMIHELLHLKFVMSDCCKNTVEGMFFGVYEHTLIEQMSKSFIMAKYNLPFEWFKNF